jgi:hypothetical protein
MKHDKISEYFIACENFDYFWQTELSKVRPEKNEDTEEFAKRIAELAYLKALEVE